MPIIDIHVHVGFFDPESPPEGVTERMRRAAGSNAVDKVLLLGNVMRYPTPEQVQVRNNATLRLMEQDPAFYLGACYLNPQHDPAFIRQEVARCVGAGMVAIKLWIDVLATDPRLDPVMKAAAEWDLPVLHHAWYKTTGNYQDESNAAEIAHLARRHPSCKIIMAHLTGVAYRGVLDVEDLPNVWVDTSGAQPESDIVEYAISHLGADRIVYGSDWPGRGFDAQLGRIYGARMTEAEREKILWRNTASLLKLKEVQ